MEEALDLSSDRLLDDDDDIHVGYCVTRRNAAGSTPGGFIVIFHRMNYSGPTMALGSTQFLTEMSTRDIWGKGGRYIRLTFL